MKVLAICITWNRPQLLGRSIHCFLSQTNTDGRLLVLDDAGQYEPQEHERWALVSTSTRYPTMGEKRNACIDLALERYPEIDAFMLWDDDDVYFPHAIQCVSDALDAKCWAQPRHVFEMSKNGKELLKTETWQRHRDPNKTLCYGGCWAWRMDTFNSLGRFPRTNNGEDIKVAWPCLSKHGPSADSSPNKSPWYYYNRLNNSISDEGNGFYAIRARQTIEVVDELSIGWNGTDIYNLPVADKIHPRPW